MTEPVEPTEPADDDTEPEPPADGYTMLHPPVDPDYSPGYAGEPPTEVPPPGVA